MKIKVTPQVLIKFQAQGQPPHATLVICLLLPEILVFNLISLSILGKSWFESDTSFLI